MPGKAAHLTEDQDKILQAVSRQALHSWHDDHQGALLRLQSCSPRCLARTSSCLHARPLVYERLAVIKHAP